MDEWMVGLCYRIGSDWMGRTDMDGVYPLRNVVQLLI
jgi:hypothetical protein